MYSPSSSAASKRPPICPNCQVYMRFHGVLQDARNRKLDEYVYECVCGAQQGQLVVRD